MRRCGLPFKDGSFDLVISSDTLEHLPKSGRRLFCEELLRVCRKGVILCAPFGTVEHIAEEKLLADDDRLPETVRCYLQEHVRYGLPTPNEVGAFKDCFQATAYYQGDFRDVKRTSPNGRVSFPGLMRIIAKNFFAVKFWTRETHLTCGYGPHTNRFFLVIDKSYSGNISL